MKYSFEIFSPESELSIIMKNLNLEILQELSKEETIDEIVGNKYYLYGMFDKVEVLGNSFMIMKSTKKSVIMVMM